MTLHDLSDPVKHAADAVAGVTIIATLMSWMPSIAAVLAVIWTCLRIYETIQNIRLNNHKWRGRE